MKLGANQAELVQLMQKFMQRSRIGIFRNKHTRSTPLDPKLMFWCVRTILVHLGLFGSLTKLGAKRAELVQKFGPRSRFEIFRNERTDPSRWTLNSYFAAFHTILVHWGPFG